MGFKSTKKIDSIPIHVSDKLMLKKIYDYEEIISSIEQVAKQIKSDYKNEPLVVLAIMNGSLHLASHLMRLMPSHVEFNSLLAESYGSKLSSGDLKISGLEFLDVENKHVLIIDDTLDTGKTMAHFLREIKKLKPLSAESLILISKQEIKQKRMVTPKYTIFTIDKGFLVGFGLDYRKEMRNLTDIYVVEEQS